MKLPADTLLEAPDDNGDAWTFDARDDLATGEALCAVPGHDGLPPVVLIQISAEERVGIALSADAARELASRLFTLATDALALPAPAPPPSTVN